MSLPPQTTIPPVDPGPFVWLIIPAAIALAVGWLYLEATNCWFKPVGKMPGWCLTAPILGLR